MSVFRFLHVLPGDSWGQPELVLPQPLIQRASHPGRRRDQNKVSTAHKKTCQHKLVKPRKDYTLAEAASGCRSRTAVGYSTAQGTDNLLTDSYHVLGECWLLAPNQNRGKMENSASEFNRTLVPNFPGSEIPLYSLVLWGCSKSALLFYVYILIFQFLIFCIYSFLFTDCNSIICVCVCVYMHYTYYSETSPSKRKKKISLPLWIIKEDYFQVRIFVLRRFCAGFLM